jgi:hypothetical protein
VSQRLNSLIASNHALRQLADKAQQLLTLQQHYEQIAPPSLRRASRVMQLQQGTLLIAAFNSAVAAKLRQMTPDMLKHLQQCGHEVTVIQIRVQVGFPQPLVAPTPPVLSSTGKQHLSELAHTLPDSALKQALERLIRGNKKP